MALSPLDFPTSPTIGQTYPSPPVAGQPQYIWDGADWLSYFALGKAYVPLDGSTAMTGLLILSGDPTAVLGAATKQYVDQGDSPIAMTMQIFLSGSGIYTRPANCRRIHVRMVGGGGGGGAALVGIGGNGTATTFGTSLLVANGGQGGNPGNCGGYGGTASLGAGPLGFAMNGGPGGATQRGSANSYWGGGTGGVSPLGGAGGGQIITPFDPVLQNAAANSGSGGGGGGGNATNTYSGSGGGAGGYVDAHIISPVASYTYAVGAKGAGGVGSGLAGGDGGAGGIWIEEYYR